MQFKPDFLIGAATAAHQVEGNNINSDFWKMEQMEHSAFTEPSLDCVDHYHLYEEDIRLLAGAGLNAYRFSIEWARIEPEEGRFDENEMQHYLDMIACCRKYDVEPVVTLHHFSSPAWLISLGGWESEETPGYFARYVHYVMSHIGNKVRYVCTINEMNMGIMVAEFAKKRQRQLEMSASGNGDSHIQMGLDMDRILKEKAAASREYMLIFGVESPACFNFPLSEKGDSVVMRAHVAAREAIRRICPDVKVGSTLSLHEIQAEKGGEQNAAEAWEKEFLHYLPVIKDDDFLGVQNYCRARYDEYGAMPTPEGAELTQMKYEFYPDSVGPVIRRVAESFEGDLIVTENGTAVSDDSRRVEFIRRALNGVKQCVDDGIPVKGYFYWSLMDNFEWQRGYALNFGLVEVDRSTQERIIKPSLEFLGSFCSK